MVVRRSWVLCVVR